MENYQRKTPDVFEKFEAVLSFNGEKHRVQLFLAFIKQQSGESVTETLCFTFDLQPQTLLEKDTDWLKWKSKAEELYRIKETPMAQMLYVSSILLLKRKPKNDIQQGNSHGVLKTRREIAKLWTKISKIQLKQVNGIYGGKAKPGVDFWGEVLIAFHATIKAVQSDPCWSRSYERMHTIVMKLKCHYSSRSTDSCDSRFDYRATFFDFLNKNFSVLTQKTTF